jgi:hypothetical protein
LHPIDHQSNPVNTSFYGASGSNYLIYTPLHKNPSLKHGNEMTLM